MPIHTINWFVALTIVFFSRSCISSQCFKNFSPADYPSCILLSPNVSMHWVVQSGTITWAIDVDGVWDWVGFGISEGGMLGADLAVALHDFAAHRWTAADYWSADFETPQLDTQQDVSLVSISRQIHKDNLQGSTLVAMRRPLVTCDPAGHDRPVLNDTRQTVVFAYGVGSFSYHGPTNRGQAEVTFLPNNSSGASAENVPQSALQTLDIRMPSFSVPTAPTTYQCLNLAVPADAKYHIYASEPIIDNQPLVHHFVVYTCRGSSPPPTPLGQPYDCLKDMECEDFYMGWAPGIQKYEAPADACLAFGNGTSTRYLVLQIHYDNLEGVAGQIDTSGFRLYYSSTLKKYDMGVITLGSYGIDVPPGAPSWSTQPNICPPGCTAQLAAGAGPLGLVLVSSFYHMHQLGRSMVTRHVRDGVELQPLGSRDFFSFDYQSTVNIPAGTRQLLPNDTLITTCTYTGTGRTNTTRFGLASNEEMCFNFLSYYPYNPNITECVEAREGVFATCASRDVLLQIRKANDSNTAVQAAVQAGQIVAVPANFTFRPYQPACARSAPEPASGSSSGNSLTDGDVDDDDDDDEEEEEEEEEEERRHKRNVGGVVAAILLVTVAGAVAIFIVYRTMKKKKQLEEEQHLFDKYNPNSILVPVLGGGVVGSSSDPAGGNVYSKDDGYGGKDTYYSGSKISSISSEMVPGRG
ncbi:hypothetical protein Vafri_21959, partial [Volvox africanus]